VKILSKIRLFVLRLYSTLKGRGQFGLYQELQPYSRDFGFHLGTPIDRFYINSFVKSYKNDIQGTVYEIGDDQYSKRYAQKNSRIIILNENNRHKLSVQVDLNGKNPHIYNTADCVILTQTLNFVYNFHNAINEVLNILKSGGVCLITVAGISQISRYDMDRWGDYWRFTDLSVRKMLEKSSVNYTVEHFGNYYACANFLAGVPLKNINLDLLNFVDTDYQLIIGARMVKD
jgi:SAM-dependent methyltransferase